MSYYFVENRRLFK